MAAPTAEEIARRWVELVNLEPLNGEAPEDRVLELFAPDVEWHEMPSAVQPLGRFGDRDAYRRGLEGERSVLRNRSIQLHEVVADGDRAAMRIRYEATINADGLPVPRDTAFSMECVLVITVENGKIVRSDDYVAQFQIVGGGTTAG